MLDLEDLKRGVREDVEAIVANKPFPFMSEYRQPPVDRHNPIVINAHKTAMDRHRAEIKEAIACGVSIAQIARKFKTSAYYINKTLRG